MLYMTKYPSPVGEITLASDGENLSGLWIQGQKYFESTAKGQLKNEDDLPVFSLTKAWLNQYFSGKKPEISALPLCPAGSGFRQDVWKILCEIPYGTVITYGEIAKKMALKMEKKTMSAQAVGGAVGHNPISIIIPCHRVVGAGGNLTGYAGGIDIKIRLLELEGLDMSGFFVPEKGTAL